MWTSKAARSITVSSTNNTDRHDIAEKWTFVASFVTEHAVVLNNLSEWLLFNANSAIFQLYHGENDIFIEIKRPQHVKFENQIPAWDRHKDVVM
jgi:hypothetical protein